MRFHVSSILYSYSPIYPIDNMVNDTGYDTGHYGWCTDLTDTWFYHTSILDILV